VPGLLADLVEQVGDAGVGVVVGPGDHQAEAGHEPGLELEPGLGDGGQGQPAEGGELLVVERVLVEAGRGHEQVAG
jgi:hypothetical protein